MTALQAMQSFSGRLAITFFSMSYIGFTMRSPYSRPSSVRCINSEPAGLTESRHAQPESTIRFTIASTRCLEIDQMPLMSRLVYFPPTAISVYQTQNSFSETPVSFIASRYASVSFLNCGL